MFKTIWRPFYQISFVYLTLFLVLGMISAIVFKPNNQSALYVLFLILFLGILTYNWRNKNNFIPFFTLQILTFVFGIWLQSEREDQSQLHLFNTMYAENAKVLLHIEKIENQQKEWGKGFAKVLQIENQTLNPSYRILFFLKNDELNLKKGDVIWSSSPIEMIKNKGNPGEFDGEYYWKSQGISHLTFLNQTQLSWVDQIQPNSFDLAIDWSFQRLKNVLQNYLQGDALALAEALILGDKSDLTEEIKTGFTKTGALHVLAVSGLHIGIIMQILLFVLKFFARWISRNQAIVGVVLLMWFYALLTGFSASVVRSVFMFSILSISQLNGRNYNPINVLFFTGFALLVANQNYLLDIGFQLSFFAMLGIFLFYEAIQTFWTPQSKIIKIIWQGTAVGFAAQLFTTPLSLYYFHQFPNYFILTNLGLMASTGLILGGGILLFTTSFIQPLAKVIALLLMLVLNASLWVISFIEHLPGGVAYGYTFPFLLVILLSVFLWLRFTTITWIMKLLLNGLILLIIFTMVYLRLQNMKSNDLWVMNDNQALIVLKIGQKTYCFHEDKRIDKVKKYMIGFQSIYPSEINYLSLKKDYQLKTEIGIFKISKKGGNIYVNAQNKTLGIIRNESFDELKFLKIALPFFEGEATHYLKDGPFRLNLSFK